MSRPEQERVALTNREHVIWTGMLGRELRQDMIGKRSRGMLAELMAAVVASPRGWCDCADHEQMVGALGKMMWKDSY